MYAWLLGALAIPWTVHALVVTLSAVGAHPLGGRLAAILVLAASVAGVLEIVRGTIGESRSVSGPPRTGSPGAEQATLSNLYLPNAFVLAACAALLLSLVAAVVLPIVAYDALAYRLPTIASWLDAGRVAWIPTDDPVRNGYPLGQEAVSAVIAAATGSMRFVAVTSFSHVVAGALSIWIFCEECGVRRPFSRAAGAVFVLVPMVLLNASSGYVDAAFAAATVSFLCLTALLVTAESPQIWLGAAVGMAAADVLSLKGTGVIFAALALLSLAMAAIWRRRALRLGVAFAFAAPGAFWTVRNVVHTHNPIWPVDLKLAGHTVFHGIGSANDILDVAHNTPAAFSSLSEAQRILHTWLELGGPAHDFDDRRAGLGLAWVLVAIPAIVWVLAEFARTRRRELRPVVVVIALTALCFLIQPMRWWPRYVLWVWGAGAAAIGIALESFSRREREPWLSIGLAVLFTLSVGEGAIAVSQANGANLAAWRGLDPRDLRRAANAVSWVSPEFWRSGVAADKDVCRGDWKPGTDNGNLDGVFAQLRPRPHVHIVPDDSGSWPKVRAALREAGCTDLLLFRGSPVVPLVGQDTHFAVEVTNAFDPLFVVRARAVPASEIARRLP